MKCSKCGRPLRQGQRFCSGCGMAAGGTPASPAAAPPRQAGPAARSAVPKNQPPPPPPPPPSPQKNKVPSGATRKPSSPQVLPNRNQPKPAPKGAGGIPVQQLPQRGKKGGGAGIWSALAFPWKLIPPIDKKIAGGIKSGLSAALILVAVFAIFIFVRNPKPPEREKVVNAPVLPPGARVLYDKATETAGVSAIEVRLVVGNSVQEEDLRKLLNNMFAAQKNRMGLRIRKASSRIVIYAYAAEDIYRDDPAWWVGRLYWTEGKDPTIELNMIALIPRRKAAGYSGLSRDEYLNQTDTIASEVISAMSSMDKVFKDYEKMNINGGEFKKKGREYAEALARNTNGNDLPVPPFNDCVELDAAFKNMLGATKYFQDMFSESSDLFDKRGLDTEEFYNNLTEFTRRSGVYNVERGKYNKK